LEQYRCLPFVLGSGSNNSWQDLHRLRLVRNGFACIIQACHLFRPDEGIKRYYDSGELMLEGSTEYGLCCGYHKNGQLAAEGFFKGLMPYDGILGTLGCFFTWRYRKQLRQKIPMPRQSMMVDDVVPRIRRRKVKQAFSSLRLMVFKPLYVH